MNHRTWTLAFSLAVVSAARCERTAAIAVGEVDDFSVNLEGWRQGRAGGLTRPTTGGPTGDAFMRVFADGIQPALSRLVVFNQSQWAGDYIGAGVTAISLAANNLGSTNLNLRVAFGTANDPNSGTWFSSTNGIALPAASGWTSIQFPIGPGDLTRVAGLSSYESTMNGVVTLRLLHSPTPNTRGAIIAATLGVDNIVALGASAPEPGDFDGDGDVDGDDLDQWQTHFGSNDAADADEDGDSDGADFLLWQQNLDVAASAPVPEPTSLGICLLIVTGIAARRVQPTLKISLSD
jgi:hypothetical protein